jgi:hypothetical protein
VSCGDLLRDRLQACLVKIRKRKVAAASREFQRERSANTARRARDGGGGSLNFKYLHTSPLKVTLAAARVIYTEGHQGGARGTIDVRVSA